MALGNDVDSPVGADGVMAKGTVVVLAKAVWGFIKKSQKDTEYSVECGPVKVSGKNCSVEDIVKIMDKAESLHLLMVPTSNNSGEQQEPGTIKGFSEGQPGSAT